MADKMNVKVTLDRPHLTKDKSRIDRRYKLSGTISSKTLKYAIQKELASVVKDLDSIYGTSTEKTDNVKSTVGRDEKRLAKKRANAWRTSIMGVSIASRSLFSTGTHLLEGIESTDKVARDRTLVNSMVSGVTTTVGAFGGPWGAVAATIMSTAWFVFGNKVNNSIQRSGEKNRFTHSFSVYDTYKYGTYCYDNSSGEWVADDANKAHKRILGKKSSV